MSDLFRAGIVQVQAYQVGSGFIVSVPTADTFFIVTCAHVLGQPSPAATAKVMFSPSAEAREISIDPARCYVCSDVAFLPLPGPLPEGAQALTLGSSQGSQGHSIQAFGFPSFNGYVEGVWGRGNIDGPVNSPSGNKLLQLSSEQITRGFSGSAIWDEYAQRVVGVVTAIQDGPDEFGKGGKTVYAISTEELRELLPDLKLVDICPYRGLHPFREQDATYFFGRERYIEELLHCLQKDKRLLAILGPIGSGKTSVVQAGLIPQLRKNRLPRSERWHIEILPATQDPEDPCSCAAFFGSSEHLVEGANQWYKEHASHERLVLIFDHFEHIFTPAYDPLRQAFLNEFVKLIESNLVTVILIMRDDYYSLLAEHTALIKLVEQHLCNIPAMTNKNILSVIEEPAAITGIWFEGNLSSFIAADAMRATVEPVPARLKRHSSILSSLSVCLRELWERRVDNELMLEEYQSLGGVFGALPQRANEIYYTLTESQQRLARRIFTDLVSPGDEQAGRLDSRVRKTLSALCRYENERSNVHEIVERFAQAGLLENNLDDLHQDVFVQIIHEIVLREWELLQSWLRDDHQFMSWYHDIQIRTQQWIASSPTLGYRDQDLLLRGRSSMIASEWLDERAVDIHADVQAFIRESSLFCEQEQQRKKRMEEVQQQGRVALAKQLATQAQLVEMQEPRHIQRSLLLAVEALKRHPCLLADQSVRRGLNLLPLCLLRLTRSSSIRLITFGADGSTLAAADQYHILWTHAVSQVSYFKEYLLPEPTSIALSSDGYSLVAAGKDHCAWLVDTMQGRPLLYFPHAQHVRAVALSHHHPYRIATASDDMTVGIWDGPDSFQFPAQHHNGATEAHRRYLLKHGGAILLLAFSPDDQYLATVCADNKARIWDVGSGALLAILEHQRPLHLLAFSPDGNFVACADDAYTAVVWQWEQPRRGKKKAIRKRQCLHRGVIRALKFSPDGSCLLTASDDATARIWDIRHENEIQEIKYFQHQGPITAACFHPRGQYIATASEDHTARIWEVNGGQVVHYLPHEGPVTSVAFHPMKPYIVTGSADGELVIWETGRSSQVTCFEHEGKVRDFFIGTYHRKYHLSLALEEQNSLQLMDLVEGDHIPITVFQGASSPSLTFAPDGRSFVFYDATAIAFSPDGRCVATSHEDGMVKVWDTRREYPPARLSCNGRVHALTFSADGQYVAVACYDGLAFVWAWNSVAEGTVVRLSHPNMVSAVTFTPDGTSLVTTCEDHLVRLWKWKENSQHQMVDLCHQNRVHQAIVSPTGEYLLTVSQDQGARIWDSTTGSLISYKTHRDTVLAATFSPDGAYVATGSSDGTVGIWEAATDRQLASLEHQGSVYACKFSADGKYLATASDNGLVCVWIWRPEDLIREANFHLTRNLTEEEWRLYIGNEPYQRTCLYLGWRETPLKSPFPPED